jgi:3-deoxy-manno-octulosonate cytidylyltransferase (CMP-KDO synthetase)
MTTALIVIPARMAATRLPGKPLADIMGRPMIAWMADIGRKTGLGPVLVAAGEPEIVAAAEAAGAKAVLTDPALPSGSDRVHAAADQFDPHRRFDLIVNLQGDMPTIGAEAVVRSARLLDDASAEIATLVSPSTAAADRDNPNIVKAIMAMSAPDRGRALYFTRAAAPTGAGPIWRHIGLYVYRRAALARYVAAPPSPLEQRERLEQLRALEMGMNIVAGLETDFPKGVDSPADLDAVRRRLQDKP